MKKKFLYPLRKLHGKLHERKLAKKQARDIEKKISVADSKTFFYIFTPTYGNIGDQAIALATEKYLDRHHFDYIVLCDRDLYLLKRFGKIKIMNHHNILITGGGFLGTLWFSAEQLLREIFQELPNSRIICLPNTIFYENTEWGTEELKKSVQIYNSHKSLKICAREKTSYQFMKSKYNDVVLIPDMVLSLNECRPGTPRSGCLLCLRSDIEKTRSDEADHTIRAEAASIFGENVCDTDMTVDHSIPIENRTAELEAKFDQFRHAELVITDRLHGMIFAAITGTPCVVIDSKSPKVRGCYEWIRGLNYIRFADSPQEISRLFSEIPSEEHFYSNSHLETYYDELSNYIEEMIH